MLERFKAPNGKKLNWASEFVVTETESNLDVEETLENDFTALDILKMNGVDSNSLKD